MDEIPTPGLQCSEHNESFCKDGVRSGPGEDQVNEPVSILVGSVEMYVSECFRAGKRGPKVSTEEAIKPTLR